MSGKGMGELRHGVHRPNTHAHTSQMWHSGLDESRRSCAHDQDLMLLLLLLLLLLLPEHHVQGNIHAPAALHAWPRWCPEGKPVLL